MYLIRQLKMIVPFKQAKSSKRSGTAAPTEFLHFVLLLPPNTKTMAKVNPIRKKTAPEKSDCKYAESHVLKLIQRNQTWE